MEYLLAEPKCNDLVADVLGFGTLNPQKSFSVGEFSQDESDRRKTDGGNIQVVILHLVNYLSISSGL